MRRLKTIASALALALIGLVIMPAAAYAAPAQAQLTIINQETKGGAAIPGAVYTVTRTHTINESTGAATAVTVAGVTVNAGATLDLDQYAVYSIKQTTRAPGYLLDTRTWTVEFPRLTAGTIATDQSLTINPKLTKVAGDASLLKTANETTTPVVDATFDLYRTKDYNGNTIDPAVKVNTTSLTTGADGKITATALEEGEYYFIETGTVAPYALDTTTKHTFTVTVDAAGTATATIPELRFKNYTKPSDATVTKLVNGAATANASIDEQITFTINVDVPLDIKDYASYTLSDTFDSRFSNVAIVNTGDNPLPTGITASAASNVVSITINPATVVAGANTITLTANLNNTTASGSTVPNTATVSYDNGRGDTGTFATSAANVSLVEGSITINKFMSDEKTPLAGATFELQDVNGKVITPISAADFSPKTGDDGVATFNRLPYGTYYVVEKAAPEGYRLSTAKTEVVLNADGAAKTVELNNYLLTEELPATGTLGAIPFYVAGAGLIGLFVFFLRRSRREEQTEATNS